MYFIGYDIGSSSVKAALLDTRTNQVISSTSYPDRELDITAQQEGWAEQDPDIWWTCVVKTTETLLSESGIDPFSVQGLGISYQMHGLVLVDEDHNPLRPSIIWCDSRAVEIGHDAANKIGIQKSLKHHLNTPGNFTISKLLWVKENEPEIYQKIKAFMLPGDYIVSKFTGEITSTISGYSEGISWDFIEHEPSSIIMQKLGIDKSFFPPVLTNIGIQATLSTDISTMFGFKADLPIAYRAGDQPNNALSLGVVNPGQVAATGGTSGVVYGVLDQLNYDEGQRVNSFAHVNHTKTDPRIGVLLCINGAGIAYSWMRNQVGDGTSFDKMATLVDRVSIGSDGLIILPFGNGAERMFENKQLGSSVHHLNWNIHKQGHLYRATLEGIAFGYVYGMSILKGMGIDVSSIRVGNDNLFQSAPFSNAIATLMNCEIHVIETNGAAGAARGAAIGLDVLSLDTAFDTLTEVKVYQPQKENLSAYQQSYARWESILNQQLEKL